MDVVVHPPLAMAAQMDEQKVCCSYMTPVAQNVLQMDAEQMWRFVHRRCYVFHCVLLLVSKSVRVVALLVQVVEVVRVRCVHVHVVQVVDVVPLCALVDTAVLFVYALSLRDALGHNGKQFDVFSVYESVDSCASANTTKWNLEKSPHRQQPQGQFLDHPCVPFAGVLYMAVDSPSMTNFVVHLCY